MASRLGSIFRRPAGTLRPGWRLLLYLVALIGASAAASRTLRAIGVGRPFEEGVVQAIPTVILGSTILLVTLLVTGLMMRLLDRRPLSTLGLPLRPAGLGGFACGLVIGGLPVSLLLLGLAGSGHARIGWALQFGTASMWTLLAAGVGMAALSTTEEFVFRGYAMQLLAEGLGPWGAALITGALFGLAHSGNPGSNPLGLINTAVNAMLLALLMFRTGSMWIPIGSHIGWNLTGALLFGARVSGFEQPATLMSTRLSGPDWLTGGEYGYEGSALAGPLELIVLVVALLIASRLPGHPEMRRYFRRWRKPDPVGQELPGSPSH